MSKATRVAKPLVKSTRPDKEEWETMTFDEVGTEPWFTLDVTSGEGLGKSHLARTFQGAIVWIETPPEAGKSDIVLNKFRKQYGDETKVYFKRALNFNDIRQAIRFGINNPEVKTIVIDSGTHLRRLAAAEWLQETGKNAVHPPTQWQWVNRKIDDAVGEVKKAQKYLVITNRLKNEWIGDSTTGRKIRAGYDPFTYDLHIVMEIVWGLTDPNTGRVHYKERKFAKVTKNAFWGIDEKTNRNYGKPYLFQVDFEGIQKELLKPWGKGVPAGKEFETCLAEAKSLITKGE